MDILDRIELDQVFVLARTGVNEITLRGQRFRDIPPNPGTGAGHEDGPDPIFVAAWGVFGPYEPGHRPRDHQESDNFTVISHFLSPVPVLSYGSFGQQDMQKYCITQRRPH